MSGDRVIGYVKWFNSKKGYGFVTVVTPNNEHTGDDVFLHFSNINVMDDNYKRVFPGEYVETLVGSDSDGRTVCTEVTGPHGGTLLTDNEKHRFKVFPKMNYQEEAQKEAQEEVQEEVQEEAQEEAQDGVEEEEDSS